MSKIEKITLFRTKPHGGTFLLFFYSFFDINMSTFADTEAGREGFSLSGMPCLRSLPS